MSAADILALTFAAEAALLTLRAALQLLEHRKESAQIPGGRHA